MLGPSWTRAVRVATAVAVPAAAVVMVLETDYGPHDHVFARPQRAWRGLTGRDALFVDVSQSTPKSAGAARSMRRDDGGR